MTALEQAQELVTDKEITEVPESLYSQVLAELPAWARTQLNKEPFPNLVIKNGNQAITPIK